MSGSDAQNPISVTVLFFAAAKDAARASELLIKAPYPATVRSIKAQVFDQLPEISRMSRSLMVAVNETYAVDETQVMDGDVVAFLPPVSGG